MSHGAESGILISHLVGHLCKCNKILLETDEPALCVLASQNSLALGTEEFTVEENLQKESLIRTGKKYLLKTPGQAHIRLPALCPQSLTL